MSDPVTHLNAALEGRYAIEGELGEGGMATVYLRQRSGVHGDNGSRMVEAAWRKDVIHHAGSRANTVAGTTMGGPSN